MCGRAVAPLAVLPLEPESSPDYDETCASNPGDRCLTSAPIFFPWRAGGSEVGWQGWGRGKSELRRAVCSLTARVGGGFPVGRDVRQRYGKCHRKHTARQLTGKGEKVRGASVPL